MQYDNEIELINLIKTTGNSDALKKLVQMHSGIICNKIRQFSIPSKAAAHPEEFFANRYDFTYQAVLSYQPEKAKFNTHLGNYVRYNCLDEMKKLIEEDENNFEINDLITLKDSNFSYEDKNQSIDDYLALVDNKEMIKVLRMRFEENLGWAVIGKRLGYSHTWAMEIAKSGLEIIKKKLNSKMELV